MSNRENHLLKWKWTHFQLPPPPSVSPVVLLLAREQHGYYLKKKPLGSQFDLNIVKHLY